MQGKARPGHEPDGRRTRARHREVLEKLPGNLLPFQPGRFPDTHLCDKQPAQARPPAIIPASDYVPDSVRGEVPVRGPSPCSSE